MDDELRQRLDNIEAALNTILYLMTSDESDEDLIDLDGNEYGVERDQVSLS